MHVHFVPLLEQSLVLGVQVDLEGQRGVRGDHDVPPEASDQTALASFLFITRKATSIAVDVTAHCPVRLYVGGHSDLEGHSFVSPVSVLSDVHVWRHIPYASVVVVPIDEVISVVVSVFVVVPETRVSVALLSAQIVPPCQTRSCCATS